MANGKVERFNRTLVGMLRKVLHDHPGRWEEALPSVLMAYRCTPSEPTGFNPYRLAVGSEMRLGVDYGTPFPEPPARMSTLREILRATWNMRSLWRESALGPSANARKRGMMDL